MFLDERTISKNRLIISNQFHIGDSTPSRNGVSTSEGSGSKELSSP
jgi:hypothetical protein